ncbi:hypothetical protein RB195_002769 [Necator americanus]
MSERGSGRSDKTEDNLEVGEAEVEQRRKPCSPLCLTITAFVAFLMVLSFVAYLMRRTNVDIFSQKSTDIRNDHRGLTSGNTATSRAQDDSSKTVTNSGTTNKRSTAEVTSHQSVTVSYLEKYRLPTNLKPVSYNLIIKIYLPFYVDYPPDKKLTTDGEVTVDIYVLESTNLIVLNQNGLALIPDRCEAHSNDARLSIKNMTVDNDLEKVTFVLTEPLQVHQKVKLKVFYTGVVGNTLDGLYQNMYSVAVNSGYKIAAVTQFEPAHARKMVPCFDEPEYKAVWNVTVIHPNGTAAISNGLEMSETMEPNGRWKVTKFHSTPMMSSYLLAIFVSEFHFSEAYTKRGTRIRVWSSPLANKERMGNALKMAVACYNLFEEYFGINDVVVKQDLVAVKNFYGGAMENWGLMTFRDKHLLQWRLERVMVFVAHELAHQWFGNLVTMKYWDDLWLKEGFASFFEKTLYQEKLHEEGLRMSTIELVSDLYKGLTEDSLATSRPLSSIIHTPMEVRESFDTITYKKGAAVIAMIRSVVGGKIFRKAINHFLKKFSFKNVRRDDLWQAFDEVIETVPGPNNKRLDMLDFGNQWTTQMGFPLVTVRTFNSTAVIITQEKYMLNTSNLGLAKYRSPHYGYKWDVPIWYRKLKGEPQFAWLKRNEPLYIKVDPTEKPVVLNVFANGYYRQNYETDGWLKIKQHFTENPKEFSELERVALINDAFAAALIDRLDYEILLDLVYFREEEKSGVVLQAVSNGLHSIRMLFYGRQEQKLIESYMRNVFGNGGYKKLIHFVVEPTEHRNEENLFDKRKSRNKIEQLRLNMEAKSSSSLKVASAIVETMCDVGEKNCIKTFRSLFEKEVLNKCRKGEKASKCVRIKSHLRRHAYCTGVKALGTVALRKVEDLLKVEDNPEERRALRSGAACNVDSDVNRIKR